MTTYTISLDLIRHMEYEDYTPMLFRLINKDCEHEVAVDNRLKLLSAYERESLHSDILSTWIKLLQHSHYAKINYDVNEETLKDRDILEMTGRVVGSRKMIVDSLQSVGEYAEVNANNEAISDGKSVPVVNKIEAMAEIRGTNSTVYIEHSQIASNHGTISGAKIR